MPAQALTIVADDLTGAMDSSGYFAEKGFDTLVLLGPDYPLEGDVVVITTNSRADGPGLAREKVRQAAKRLVGGAVYKKIDSTLRGNIGVELEATMEELDCEKAVVAPAFPAVGRTTVDGVLLVDGTGVAETQFAHDPVSPVKESHIPTLLEKTTGHRAGCVALRCVEAGPEALYRHISAMREAMVVCDATEQLHLTAIAQAAALAQGRWLLCGSGGLARELQLLLPRGTRPGRRAPSNPAHGPALVVVGTRNQVAAEQLDRARGETGLPILDLDVERLKDGNGTAVEVSRMAAEASRFLGQGRSLALTSTFSRYVPALKRTIPIALAEAVASALTASQPAGLFLSGGDIALEVCRRLSVSSIRVHGEVEPGVPAGEVVGGDAAGIRLVTKAGGFGTGAALIKSISYLEKGCLT